MSECSGWVIILLFALAFCGKPDLHDSLIKYVDKQVNCESGKEQEVTHE